jgi:hypothetical protein
MYQHHGTYLLLPCALVWSKLYGPGLCDLPSQGRVWASERRGDEWLLWLCFLQHLLLLPAVVCHVCVAQPLLLLHERHVRQAGHGCLCVTTPCEGVLCFRTVAHENKYSSVCGWPCVCIIPGVGVGLDPLCVYQHPYVVQQVECC